MNTVYTLMDIYENQLIDIFENKYKAVLGARDYILYMVRKGKWDAWEKEIAILESTNTMAIERVITESYPFLVIKGRMVI